MNTKKQCIILKNGDNIKKIIAVVCVFFNWGVASAQTPKLKNNSSKYFVAPRQKNSMFCCYNYVLSNINNDRSNKFIDEFKSEFVNNKYRVQVKNDHFVIADKVNKKMQLSSASCKIEEWDQVIDWTNVQYSFVNNSGNDILIVKSTVAGVSGLETNFNKYLIINLTRRTFNLVQSLSNDHRFFYIHSGYLMLYLFDYSEDFLGNRDFERISLDISQSRLEGDKLRLIKTNTKSCDCK